MPTSDLYLGLSIILFLIGFLGVLLRKNTLIVLMCIELMLNAANLLLVSQAQVVANLDAQVMVFFTMLVAAAEAAVGLGLISMIYLKIKTLDIQTLQDLKG